MNFPADLMYTKTHEWVRLEGETATVGITDYAQSELGDIVYVELPEPGRILKAGDSFGTVESVKTVSDFYSPVAGEVTDVNADVAASSDLLNRDPYGAGWLVRVRVESRSDDLMDAGAYSELIRG